MTKYRDENGYLMPGHPGLPGAGRPKVDPEIRRETQAILQAATPKAARRLAELVDNDDPRVAAMAAELILARVYGKPAIAVDKRVEVTSVQQSHLRILQDIQLKHDRAVKTIEAEAAAPTPIDTAPDAGQAEPVSPAGNGAGSLASVLAARRRAKGKTQLAADDEGND